MDATRFLHPTQPPEDHRFGARPLRQHILFVYGTGLAVGLHLALAQLALTRRLDGSLFTMAASFLFCTVILALWIWVLPRVAERSFAQRIVLQMLIALATFSILSFLLTETYVLVLDRRASILKPYVGDDLTLTITSEQLRRWPLIATLIPIVPTALLCVVSFNLYWLRINALQDRERALHELATSAQLAALRAQLNPHFFFNSLNAIVQLISTDPVKAEQCVERLAAIFRYMLGRSEGELVALADELEIAEAYLDIERARFGDNLNVCQEIDERARLVRVPGFVLQPLVENAVRHGISQKIGGGSVLIRAVIDGSDLQITVRDTGVGIQNGATLYERGVGLRNVRERLVKLYGDAYEPSISSTAGVGTTVTVRIPIRSDQISEAA